jgi:hypothetical protein
MTTSQSEKSEICSQVADAYLRKYYHGHIDNGQEYTLLAQDYFNTLWDKLMNQIEFENIKDLCALIQEEEDGEIFFGIGWMTYENQVKVYRLESKPWDYGDIDKSQIKSLGSTKKLYPIWACSECKSTNVEEQYWVKVNTRELTTPIDLDYWCPDCESNDIELVEIQ